MPNDRPQAQGALKSIKNAVSQLGQSMKSMASKALFRLESAFVCGASMQARAQRPPPSWASDQPMPHVVPHEPFLEQSEEQVVVLEDLSSLASRVSNFQLSSAGDGVNASYLENFCGVGLKVDNHFKPDGAQKTQAVPRLPSEGKAVGQGNYSMNVLQSECSVFAAMLEDLHGSSGLNDTTGQAYRGIEMLWGKMSEALHIGNAISPDVLIPEMLQVGDISPLDDAAGFLQQHVDILPVGETLMVPAIFVGHPTRKDQTGHATYLVLEKTAHDKMNISFINRGLGLRSESGQKEYAYFTAGENSVHPKGSSLVKPKIKYDSLLHVHGATIGEGTGQVSKDFWTNFLALTADSHAATEAKMGEMNDQFAGHQAEAVEVGANVELFKESLLALKESPRPPGYKRAQFQAAQKDGNCAYSSLKGAQRFILNDATLYNKVDLLRTQKVVKMADRYFRQRLDGLIPQSGLMYRETWVASAQYVHGSLSNKLLQAIMRNNQTTSDTVPIAPQFYDRPVTAR